MHAHTHLHTHTGYTRAAPGGVGGVKAVGNYVPSLKPQKEAKEDGFDNVIFLDSETGTYIEEVRAREEERQCACMHACIHPSIHPSIHIYIDIIYIYIICIIYIYIYICICI